MQITKSEPFHFNFIITGHHALPFAQMCIESIQSQLGSFQISSYYVDDASEYSQADKNKLEKMLGSINGQLVVLAHRHYQIGALSKIIPTIDSPNSIICLIDGDDYLLSHALQTIVKAYENPDIAMTYGNTLVDFRPYQDVQANYFYDKKTVNTEYSLDVWKTRSFREDGFRCFHFRTFKRWLWDYIDPQHFLRPSGDFFRASGDSAYIFPMLELLGDPKHVAFIEKPLYVYRLHEGNVHNHDKKSQSEDLEYIRFKLQKYSPLDRDLLQSLLYQCRPLCAGL
ncbi:MAG: glycosyltransferase family A protein [Chlamydiales bacterium]